MEQWTRWEPIQGLEGKYYLDSFAWLDKGFVIELIDSKQEKKIEILFYYFIDAYRYTNESFNFKVLDNASEQDDVNFYRNFSLFKVTNSDYIAWLSDRSCGWSDGMNFIHFCILGGDEYIDIVTNYEPIVTIMDYKPEISTTAYSRSEFGLALKTKVKNKEDMADIKKWIFQIYLKHIEHVDFDFKFILRDLLSMANSSKYKLSYEMLDNISDRLIAGEESINFSAIYQNEHEDKA